MKVIIYSILQIRNVLMSQHLMTVTLPKDLNGTREMTSSTVKDVMMKTIHGASLTSSVTFVIELSETA